MPNQLIIFGLVTFLHDLFTAVWIGSLIALGFSVMPAVKKVLKNGPQIKEVMEAVQNRNKVLVYISMVGLVLTGMLKANQSTDYLGFFDFGNTYSAVMAFKHLLILIMIVIVLYRSLALAKTATPMQERLKKSLMMLNIVLGIIVLLLSGFAVALSPVPPIF
jgi:uncharacterized membrane protein